MAGSGPIQPFVWYLPQVDTVLSCPVPDSLVDVVDLGAGVVALVLNRASKRNALSRAILSALVEDLAASAARADCRVIVLAARGPVFSAGADTKEVRTIAIGEPGSPEDLQAQCQNLMSQIRQPIVAYVTGDVIGGAVGLVAAADIVVAADCASFVLPESRLGLAPTLAAPPVVARIGRAAAARLMLLGDRVDARACREMGLVNIDAAPDDLAGALEGVLGALLAASPSGLAACKALARALADDRHRPTSADLFDLTKELVASPDVRAGGEAAARNAPPPWNAKPPSAGRIKLALAVTPGSGS